MALDKLVDSTQLDSDLTSVANAIRTKGGTSASLAFPADFVTAINAISGGGSGSLEDFLTASYVNTSGAYPAVFNDHKIIPKYDTEIVLWVVQEATAVPTAGSTTLYLYALWLLEGAPATQNNRANVITGGQQKYPWTSPYAYGARGDSWSIDGDGYLTAASGTWYYSRAGSFTIKIYEIPVDPTEV